MWNSFHDANKVHAPQAAILFDSFYIMSQSGKALDKIRKSEYARLIERYRSFIKGQKYTLLPQCKNLTLEDRRSLKTPLAANKRRHTTDSLKEVFDQLWDYRSDA